MERRLIQICSVGSRALNMCVHRFVCFALCFLALLVLACFACACLLCMCLLALPVIACFACDCLLCLCLLACVLAGLLVCVVYSPANFGGTRPHDTSC